MKWEEWLAVRDWLVLKINMGACCSRCNFNLPIRMTLIEPEVTFDQAISEWQFPRCLRSLKTKDRDNCSAMARR